MEDRRLDCFRAAVLRMGPPDLGLRASIASRQICQDLAGNARDQIGRTIDFPRLLSGTAKQQAIARPIWDCAYQGQC